MLKPLQIGPYKLKSNVLLAPMAGITDRPYRDICRSFGAGLVSSEMIASDVNLWHSKKSATRLISKDEAEPRCAQIVGTDPYIMAEAAKRCVDLGVQILDINMGCPAKKVCKKAAGSALMQHPDRVKDILHSVVSAVDIPITLKTRTGWEEKNKNVLEIAKIAEQSGVSALYIHGRTRAQKYTGFAEYETIRQVKEKTSLPIIINGDIKTAKDAKFVLDYSGADAILLGRITNGRPWIFDTISHYLKTGDLKEELSYFNKANIAIAHIQNIFKYYSHTAEVKTLHQRNNSTQSCRTAQKNLNWYFHSMRLQPSKKTKKNLFLLHTPEEQLDMFIQLLSELAPNSQKPASQKQR
ncbi:MAG TPA: tRNA dihydrouridine synthase DusB [Leucothrix mucor]|nr:tRNA dihydrouridine synthase DusB [Leucothrix mucor]